MRYATVFSLFALSMSLTSLIAIRLLFGVAGERGLAAIWCRLRMRPVDRKGLR